MHFPSRTSLGWLALALGALLTQPAAAQPYASIAGTYSGTATFTVSAKVLGVGPSASQTASFSDLEITQDGDSFSCVRPSAGPDPVCTGTINGNKLVVDGGSPFFSGQSSDGSLSVDTGSGTGTVSDGQIVLHLNGTAHGSILGLSGDLDVATTVKLYGPAVAYHKVYVLPQLDCRRVAAASPGSSAKLDAPIVPVPYAPNLEAGAQLGAGLVADGVTPVVFKVTGTPGDYAVAVTLLGASSSNSPLSLFVLEGNRWRTSGTLTLLPFDSTGTNGVGYAFLQGLDWSDLGPPSTGELAVVLNTYPLEDPAKATNVSIVVRPPPVVLVHDMGDDGSSGWGDDFKNVFYSQWPGDFVAPVTYGQGSWTASRQQWPCTTASLGSLAGELDGVLAAVERAWKTDWAFTRYDVVGHGQGGVLVRMLCQTDRAGHPVFGHDSVVSDNNYSRGRFRRVVTLGSPHNGSLLARYLERLYLVNDPQSFIGGELPALALLKWDPFGEQIREINNPAFPVDPRIPFAALSTAINGGQPPASSLLPLCYSVPWLNRPPASQPNGKTRGELLLPLGSDGVVDTASQLGGRGTKAYPQSGQDLAHSSVSPFLPLDPNTAVFGVGAGQSQSQSTLLASNIVALLHGDPAALGRFVLPPLLPATLATRVVDPLVPTAAEIAPAQLLSRAPVAPVADGTNLSYAVDLPAAFASNGVVVWNAVGYGTNGITYDGFQVIVDSNDQRNADLVIGSQFVGDVFLSATCSATNGPVAVASPVLVFSRPPGAVCVGLEWHPASAALSVGETFLPELWQVYDNGTRSLVCGALADITYASSDSSVAAVSPNGAVTLKAGGTATLQASYLGFVASLTVSQAMPQIEVPPLDQFAQIGSKVRFTVAASGGAPLSYLWRKDGQALGPLAGLSGPATNSYFDLNPVQRRDAGSYDVVVSNASGSVTSQVAVLTLFATNAPTLTVAAPQAGRPVYTPTFTAAGQAKDKDGLAGVYWRLNRGPWALAQTTNGWTNWTAELALSDKPNVFQAYAVDLSGNLSKTSLVHFVYLKTGPIGLSTVGNGAIWLNSKLITNQTELVLGARYTLTPKPGSGFVFSNWTGSFPSDQAALSFRMDTNLTLCASFVPNPYTAVAGTYAGLFINQPGFTEGESGYFSAVISPNGGLSAKFQQGKQTCAYSGRLGVDLTAAITVARNGLEPLSVQFNALSPDSLNGTVTTSEWQGTLLAYRAVYSAKNPSPQAQKRYTLLVLAPAAGDEPAGNGFGAVTVDASGNARWQGMMGDGEPFTAASYISAQGQWPVYASAPAGDVLYGWLSFTNQAASDLSGTLTWLQPPAAGAGPDASGFTNLVQAAGSVYIPAAPAYGMQFTHGDLVLIDNSGQSLTNPITLGPNNKALGPNGLALTFTPSSGLFKGTWLSPADGQPLSLSGAVLPKPNLAGGQFQGTNQLGAVFMFPSSE